jgi:hypothetical protein
MASANSLEKRLQIAGKLLILGLLIEALCLQWKAPIAFIIFVAIGGSLLGIGVLVYLLSLVSASADNR